MSASFPTPALIGERDARDLLVLLGGLPDPRPTGGRVHPLGHVLAVTLIAFTFPGFAHLVGAAAWAAGVSDPVLRLLGARPDPLSGTVSPPSEATIRRVISGVDPQALGTAFTQWLAARGPGGAGDCRGGECSAEQADAEQVDAEQADAVSVSIGAPAVRGVAVDGKAMRGARGHDGTRNAIPHPARRGHP